ncbi:MAG: phospholipid-binding protein [Leptolyngbyaceae cyanobacterium]
MFGNFKQINAFPAWFQSTPPERVGLNGEYDYYGLQKRVEATFSRYFTASQLEHLTVSQRGRVVILQGMVTDPAMLAKLTELAQQVEGAIRVETRWVSCEADVQNLFVAV